MTIDEAARVLSLAHHRGVHLWRFDAGCMRVLPEGWNGLDEAAAPCFTPWEAVTLARGLAAIGAARHHDPLPERAPARMAGAG